MSELSSFLHCTTNLVQVSGPSIWSRAMGWLFGCFGRGRREKLPTLCSRSSRHPRREYYKAQDRASRLPSSLRSGRPLLKDAKHTLNEREGAPHCGTQDGTKLWSTVDNCKDIPESQNLKEEVCHLRSCGIALHTPDELRKISTGNVTRSWHSWLDPSSSPVAKLRLDEVENVERCTSILPFLKGPIYESLSSGDAGKPMLLGNSEVTAEQVVCDVVNADRSSNRVALQEGSTPGQIVEGQSALTSDKVKLELDTGVDSKGVLEQESQVCSSGLLKAVPSASAGLFMFPRKRSLGYRSFVWQEPLSPVAEADSSLSSEEEENGIHTTSVTPAQLEWSVSSEDGAGSTGSQFESPSSCRRNGVPPSPDVKSEGSDVEIAPVQCSSPTISPIIQEAMLSQTGHAEKENRLANKRFLCTPGGPGKLEDRKLEDNAGRQNQASVLTPVGNLLQWKQLKEDSAPRFAFEPNMLGGGGMDLSHEGRYTGTTENAAEEVVLDVDAENYYFFKEVQQTSTEISPQIRPATSPAASRWSGCSIAQIWDGQGIPNSTRKYKEDQVVTWHSTPFDVRLDKALAFQATEVPQRELFRY